MHGMKEIATHFSEMAYGLRKLCLAGLKFKSKAALGVVQFT